MVYIFCYIPCICEFCCIVISYCSVFCEFAQFHNFSFLKRREKIGSIGAWEELQPGEERTFDSVFTALEFLVVLVKLDPCLYSVRKIPCNDKFEGPFFSRLKFFPGSDRSDLFSSFQETEIMKLFENLKLADSVKNEYREFDDVKGLYYSPEHLKEDHLRYGNMAISPCIG